MKAFSEQLVAVLVDASVVVAAWATMLLAEDVALGLFWRDQFSAAWEVQVARSVVVPIAAGLSNPLSVGSCRKKGAPAISRPATEPRFHNSVAPRAFLYHSTAVGASGTASMSDITGPEASAVAGRIGFSFRWPGSRVPGRTPVS